MDRFDFLYALDNTELVLAPSGRLETFGDTVVHYHLVCELMDRVDCVRVREGRITALKPEIITPSSLGRIDLEEFGEEARRYAEWLKEKGENLRILQYGFRLRKTEFREHVVTDMLDNVLDRVVEEVREKDDPLSAVLVGVDSPWEVCLIKLMVDLVQHSVPGNLRDISRRAEEEKEARRRAVDEAFRAAARDPGRIGELADLLHRLDLWNKYEDRFFALVKRSRRREK